MWTNALRLGPIAVITLLATNAFAGTAHQTLPSGADLAIAITTPAAGTVRSANAAVTVTGTASIGTAQVVKNTTVVFMIDRSGSMDISAGVDCTGDGVHDSMFRCIQEAIKRANRAAAHPQSSIGLTGVGTFSSFGIAFVGDVDRGAAGVTALASPAHDGDADGVLDFDEAVDGFPAQGGFSCLACGLNAAAAIFSARAPVIGGAFLNTNQRNILVLISDGVANESSAYLGGLPAGTIINAVAVGPAATCGNPDFGSVHGSLTLVATLIGGAGSACVKGDFEDLAGAVLESIGTVLQAVVLRLDGSLLRPLPSTSVELPVAGPASVTFTRTLTGLTPGAHELCATALASDVGGDGSATDCHAFRIDAAPAVSVTSASGAEGAAIALIASVVDPDGAPTVQWSYAPVAAGAGASCVFADAASVTTSITCTDDGTYAITLTASDGVNPAVSASATLTVRNVAPALSAPAAAVDEHGSVTLTWTVVDPGRNDAFTVTVHWGDGAADTFALAPGTTTFTRTHQYLDDDPGGSASDVYAVIASIQDDEGDTGTHATTVTVRNVAPTVSAVAAAATVFSGRRLAVHATFTDAGTRDTHTATIDWGDGSPIEARQVAQGAGQGSLSGEHRYTGLGAFTVTVCVTDDDTGRGCHALHLEVKPLPVRIAIKPESLNPGSRGLLKAEILSTAAFAAATVKQDTVRFGYTGHETAAQRLDRNSGKVELHFDRSALGIPAGTPAGSALTLSLTGQLEDGTHFVGSDTVRVVE